MQQQFQQASQPQPKNQNAKITAIILFVVGFIFHLFSFLPFIGLLFAVFALISYAIAFIFLCLI